MSKIADHVASVRAQIEQAATLAGRGVHDVRLLAVSKTKPLELIREAFAAGQKSFGENYVGEALAKAAEFPQAEWHFIGSLQSNKAKQVAGRFALIHSVDRAKLATVLADAAVTASVSQDILLQVHVGDEETKSGVDFNSAPELIELINARPELRLRGLMALPPLETDEAASRRHFAKVRGAMERWRSLVREPVSFSELSIGTSSDFVAAIMEGATIVRVGTAIFGARS